MIKDADMTQDQKIIALMIRQRFERDWFYPYDFMQSHLGDLFVGYEASARLSELASRFSWIESERDGKYLKRRINWAELRLALDMRRVPDDWREFIYQQRDKAYGEK